jgi:acyl-CoA thioesterase I
LYHTTEFTIAIGIIIDKLNLRRSTRMDKELVKIMAFGDSTTYGPYVDPNVNYPSQLERKLISNGYHCKVFNKGINGNTIKDGLNRINEDLQECQPHIVIIRLGVVDLFEGSSINEIRDNLSNLIGICKKQGARVILIGHKMPELPHHIAELEDMARIYKIKLNNAFFNIFPELIEWHKIDLIPDLFDGILGEQGTYFENDGHLTAKGYEIFVGKLMPLVIRNIKLHNI